MFCDIIDLITTYAESMQKSLKNTIVYFYQISLGLDTTTWQIKMVWLLDLLKK